MYEMPNYLARRMSPQQYQTYAPTTQSNAFAAEGPANYLRFASNMSPEDEVALFREMRAYQASPLKFIYGRVPRGPGYAADRGRDPMPLNYDLFSQALPRRGAPMSTPMSTPTSTPTSAPPTGDGMLGGVGRLARYEAFLNPRPTMRQRF